MKRPMLGFLVVSFLLIGTAGLAQATLISPDSIIYNSMDEYNSGFSANNLIDHSGLVTDFTSGSTELSTYLGYDTGHSSPSYSGVGFGGYYVSEDYLDFDLGDTYTLETFLLWNDNDYQGINSFELLIADNASFSDAISLGVFSATYGPTNYSLGVPLQLFALDEDIATGRYVRLVIYDNHNHSNNFINFGEIAFDTTYAASVPEPTTMLLLGSGLAGLLRFRKKIRRKDKK